MGDQVMAALLEPVLNQALQVEMTEFFQAGRGERVEDRQGYRKRSYKRQLTTRVGGA